MNDESPEHTLEFLLAFHGRVHWLDSGYRLKFDIKRVDATSERPHGLRYSFTLHDPQGKRLIGSTMLMLFRSRDHGLGPGPSSRITGIARRMTRVDRMHSKARIRCSLISFVKYVACLPSKG
jgi:hypothetical protein